jgi:hypothetical protein
MAKRPIEKPIPTTSGRQMRVAIGSVHSGKVVSMWDAPHTLIANRDGVGIGEQFELLLLDEAGNVIPWPETPPPSTQPPTDVPPHPQPPSQDAIDLAAAIVASPDCPSVHGLSIISTVTEITLTQAEQGYAMNFPGRDTWPGVIPPGWEGPINHTLWMGECIRGQWYVLPVKEGLHDYLTLGPILKPGHIAENLTYYAQPPMVGYNPRPGEMLAYFVTTGDTRRMNLHPAAPVGRSNVVLVPLTAGTYRWEPV